MSPASIGDKLAPRVSSLGAADGASTLPSICARPDSGSRAVVEFRPTELKLLKTTDPYCEAKVLSEAKTASGLVWK